MANVLVALVAVIGCALAMAFLLRSLRLPAAIAYIVTGILVGPSGFNLIHDRELLTHMGEIGVIMLLFFIGMEVSLPRLLAGWKVAVLGTGLQMAISVSVCLLATWMFGWGWKAGVLFGFIVSMSSTAVVLVMLKDSDELEHPFGQNALGILLMQDLAIVPIMILIGLMGEGETNWTLLWMQLIGGGLLVTAAIWLMRHPHVWHLPLPQRKDLDKQIMAGLLICFASATLTEEIGLSAPFGAFLAGMLLKASDQEEWVYEHLRPLYVVFVAIFFLSIGMLVDVPYVLTQWYWMLLLTFAVFVLNSGINTLVLRAFGESWQMSLLTGGLLSQIGELSFLLASIGFANGLLAEGGHQVTVAVIALTLMFSPLWMMLIRRMIRQHVI